MIYVPIPPPLRRRSTWQPAASPLRRRLGKIVAGTFSRGTLRHGGEARGLSPGVSLRFADPGLGRILPDEKSYAAARVRRIVSIMATS
jgi:hypothetical protein